MKVNLYTWFDEESKRTKFRVVCPKCGHRYHICTSPQAAWRSAVKKGFDMDSGLCKVCRVMDSMATLTEKRTAA